MCSGEARLILTQWTRRGQPRFCPWAGSRRGACLPLRGAGRRLFTTHRSHRSLKRRRTRGTWPQGALGGPFLQTTGPQPRLCPSAAGGSKSGCRPAPQRPGAPRIPHCQSRIPRATWDHDAERTPGRPATLPAPAFACLSRDRTHTPHDTVTPDGPGRSPRASGGRKGHPRLL